MSPHAKTGCVALTVLLLASSAAVAQENRRPVHEPDFFPFSVWYSGGKARAPMQSELTPRSREEWRRDLQQIRDLGFNTVRTWVEWAHAEPRQGEYKLENLRLLLELAQEIGLRVVIQKYVDSAPDWVGKAHPQARFVAQDGTSIPSQAAPGFCTDNPEIRELVHAFYTQVARVASEYPAFYGWDLWSEPHIINWANIDYIQNVQFCYCHATQARFRAWLRRKYGSLEALNRAWYRGFETWEDVEAPRFSTILSYTDYIDWKTFIYERLAEDLGARYDAVRRGGSNHVITSHAAISSILTSPHLGEGATDDFLMAERVDYYGVSIYPKHNRPETHWPHWRLMAILDFQRSANRMNRGWYIGEMQAGDGSIALLQSDPVTPADHRIWAWSAIAKGARAINVYAFYPMSSGYESGGYGLINLDGTLTERAISTGGIARLVDVNQALFLASQPVPARVAIVYNPLSQLVGGAQRRQDWPQANQSSLIGYYRVLAENNIPVDFIHRNELESGDLSQYRLIVVPYPIMFTQRAADGLRRFVERGGHAVAEARLAWNDDRGHAAEIIPGAGLHEVFGVREKNLWMRQRIELSVVDTGHQLTSGLGGSLRGELYANTVTVLSDQAQVLASIEGDPAVVASRFGNGQTLFIGSYLGWGNHPEQHRDNNAFILRLAEWAGIEKPVATSLDGALEQPLVARLHESEGGYLLFLINHHPEAQRTSVTVRVGNGNYALSELITRRRQTATVRNGRLELGTSIGGLDVEVWSIRRR
ncbi:MAG TPA: beta-galactosidase [Gemmatimonadaceae bacterium]|nr:beta-galactosidase [Gemmatimonadaceae bacterium]